MALQGLYGNEWKNNCSSGLNFATQKVWKIIRKQISRVKLWNRCVMNAGHLREWLWPEALPWRCWGKQQPPSNCSESVDEKLTLGPPMCRTSVLTVMFGVVSVRIVSCTYSDYSHYILLPFGLKSFKNYQKCYMQALLLISVSCFFLFLHYNTY